MNRKETSFGSFSLRVSEVRLKYFIVTRFYGTPVLVDTISYYRSYLHCIIHIIYFYSCTYICVAVCVCVRSASALAGIERSVRNSHTFLRTIAASGMMLKIFRTDFHFPRAHIGVWTGIPKMARISIVRRQRDVRKIWTEKRFEKGVSS